jgi:hypothetical protein
MELMSFGKSKGGVYRGQNGNDDLAMTSVNLAPFFESAQFWDLGIDTYERMPEEYRKLVQEKIFDIYRESNNKSSYNYDELRKLNLMGQHEPSGAKIIPNVVDLESLDQIQKIKQKFFKS